ncbi:MAG: trehalose-phosphatase [Cryobacterium sp.]|nr:trehalose-phosphatase [Cryobacterium sp.]
MAIEFSEELSTAVSRISRVPFLLVALDFDGTLAPIADDPWSPRALPGSQLAIESLSDRADTEVAVISGRALNALDRVVDFPERVRLVGSHGGEMAESESAHLDAEEQELLEAIREILRRVAAEFKGAEVEIKPAGTALHTRMLRSPAATEAARQSALARVVELDLQQRVTHRYGKEILEFSLRRADKGGAIQLLRAQSRADSVLFIGDDVTDEDGFAVMTDGDVGIKVGPGETSARFRVEDPSEVEELLGVLDRERAAFTRNP